MATKLLQGGLRTKNQFSIIMIDIDHFKAVNDNYGHQIGDEVLKFLAEKMSEIVRGDDVCVRLGGEEFVVLLAETDVQEAMVIAERLRTKCFIIYMPNK